jgi:hypothetical protein
MCNFNINKNHMKSLMTILLAFAVFISSPAHSFSFVNGNIYSTSDDAINQYTETGELVGSLSLSQFGYDLRGIAFGLDRNLYVVRSSNNLSYVDVIRGDGALIKSYDFTGSIAGNISYGKIAFDPRGENFFVGTVNGVYKFNTQDNNGSLYINQSAFDLDVTSSGDLIVASDYSLLTYSSEGILKNSITSLLDPNNITNDISPRFVDIRGVEYDDVSDKTFVTMLGYSGIVDMSFKLIQLDGLTKYYYWIRNLWVWG